MMPAQDSKFEPDNAFYSMLGVAFAVMITIAAAMTMILPGMHETDAAAQRTAVTRVSVNK